MNHATVIALSCGTKAASWRSQMSSRLGKGGDRKQPGAHTIPGCPDCTSTACARVYGGPKPKTFALGQYRPPRRQSLSTTPAPQQQVMHTSYRDGCDASIGRAGPSTGALCCIAGITNCVGLAVQGHAHHVVVVGAVYAHCCNRFTTPVPATRQHHTRYSAQLQQIELGAAM